MFLVQQLLSYHWELGSFLRTVLQRVYAPGPFVRLGLEALLAFALGVEKVKGAVPVNARSSLMLLLALETI